MSIVLAQITVDVGQWLEAFQVLGPFLGVAMFLAIVNVVIIAKIQVKRVRVWAQVATLILIIASCAAALIVGAINSF